MQVQSIRQLRPNAAGSRTGQLVEAIGTARFAERLFVAMREIALCDHLSVFAVDAAAQPRVILAASSDGSRVAEDAGNAYVAHGWNLDPSNAVKLPRRQAQAGFLMRWTSDEVESAGYRRSLYTKNEWARVGSRITERVCMWLPDATASYKVSLYRHREHGAFDAHEIDRTAAAADLVLALLRKHQDLVAQPADTFPGYVAALERVAPGLPRRVAEVCAGIALGMTSEAIGLKLGIKVNTVRTHRKRAYAHLRISSQNELMKLIFNGQRPALS